MMKIPQTYILWYCNSCGYECETSDAYEYVKCECIKCKSTSVYRGFKTLPTNRISVDRTPQKYYYGSDQEKYQYCVYSVSGKQASVLLSDNDIDIDISDIIKTAEIILQQAKNEYLINSNIGRIQEVIEDMKLHIKESDKNYNINELNKLRTNIIKDIRYYNSLLIDIEES